MLNREEIARRIAENNLVSGYIDLDTQLTPNGIDLTVGQIYEFAQAGALDFSNKERVLPEYRLMVPRKKTEGDAFGWWHLDRGAYKIVTNEVVALPRDLIGIAFPRSSLLRMGVFTHTGVWDAGFQGRSEFILVVENKDGAQVKQNARVVQLMFTGIAETQHGYSGKYQHT
ncbi:MAG: deoxyuridine 5'-triphosphate nucleotidohydrolase [Candidatus Omnitrophota bacterium]